MSRRLGKIDAGLCKNCGLPMERKPRRSMPTFCCQKCAVEYRTAPRQQKICPRCGCLFGLNLTPTQFTRAMYCSRSCSNDRGVNPVTTRYRNTTRGGQHIAMHRSVMVDVIGRPLQPGEIVHHRNHNPIDNRPENLEIMTPKEHAVHHLQKHPITKNCVICGAEFTPHKTKLLRQMNCGSAKSPARPEPIAFVEWRSRARRHLSNCLAGPGSNGGGGDELE